MKFFTAMLLVFAACFMPLHAQSPLQKYAGAESLTSEQFADVVKSVWDELKKASDEYASQMKSKNDFETSQEFQARIVRERDLFWGKIVKFSNEQKLSERTFPVLANVQLVKYNADRQAYSIRSSLSVIVPPSSDRVAVTCVVNPYVFIRGSKSKGYRYAHLVMNTDPEFIWHVGPDLARAAKESEPNIRFKVWLKIDVTQPLVNITTQLSLVPVKIALINTGNNTVYWTETISR